MALPAAAQPQPPTLASVIIERIREGASLEETKEYYKFIRQIQADEAKAAFDADFVKINLPAIPRRGRIEMQGRPPRAYARLEDILEVTEPYLQSLGFRVLFEVPEETETFILMKAILVHRNGSSISATRKLPIDKNSRMNIVQGYGSIQTYAQRYAIILLLALKNCDEDDDASAAGKRDNPHTTQAADIVDVPAPDDPDRIPPPRELVPELPKMQQREVGDKLGKELAACKTLADTENWKNLESTSYRAWQLREMWRETLQGKVKEKLMELRGAAAQAAFEHERDAQEFAKYEGYQDDK